MSDYITGLFALTGAFGAIYLKDYLERKNTHTKSSRQRAIEAYALINKLPFTMIGLGVICKNVVNDKANHDVHIKLMGEYRSEAPDIIEKIELILIDYFFDLMEHFIPVKKEINDINIFLMNNIIAPSSSLDEVNNRWKQFQNNIIASTSNLTLMLLTAYINVTPAKSNFFLLQNKIKSNLKQFFSKPDID